LTITNCDIRPGGLPFNSSAIVAVGTDGSSDSSSLLELTVQNTTISGMPTSALPLSPPSPSHFKGAGIEFGVKQQVQGNLTIQNVEVRDCQGEGVLGVAQGADPATLATATIQGVHLHLNGASSSGTSILKQSYSFPTAQFSSSGLHLQTEEGGRWFLDAGESHFDQNYVHGVFLEGSSFPDREDGIKLADLDLCTAFENGLSLDPNVVGHGIYCVAHQDADMDIRLHRSAFTGNHSCGVKMELQSGTTAISPQLDVTNCTVSRNQGLGALRFSGPGGGWPIDTNPITVTSDSASYSLILHVSRCTVSNNPLPYALALWGSSQQAQDALFTDPSGSSLDTSILNKNGFTSAGGFFSDQAYYPEPPNMGGANVWTLMFAATTFCNLGRDGANNSLGAYLPVQGNYYDDPILAQFNYRGLNLGLVLPPGSPVVSPVIDRGGVAFAAETTDMRGPGFPRLLGPASDTGSLEVK